MVIGKCLVVVIQHRQCQVKGAANYFGQGIFRLGLITIFKKWIVVFVLCKITRYSILKVGVYERLNLFLLVKVTYFVMFLPF